MGPLKRKRDVGKTCRCLKCGQLSHIDVAPDGALIHGRATVATNRCEG